MKTLIIILLALLTLAQAPFDFPSNPTVGQKVTAPGGQEFQWDGTKWAAILLPSDFAPIHDPVFTGLVTAPTLNVTGNTTMVGNLNVAGITTHNSAVIPVLAVTQNLQIASPAQLLFDGFPMGGTCPAGEFVDALSNIGKLTCAAPAGGGGGGVGVWTRPTVFSFPSGWSDSGVLVYRSADGGKSIEIAGTLTGSGNPMNAGTNAIMFNIPDPLRPSKSVYAPLASQDAGFLRNIGATAQLNPDGAFRIFANTSLITVYVNLRLPVGDIVTGQ